MEKIKQDKAWIVFLGTYPPRECGIATFTADLTNNFDELYSPREETKVVAINNNLQTYKYPRKVIAQISENDPDGYQAVAEKLNRLSQVKLVSVQHEFGIYGSDYGKNLLIFLATINKPVVVTFHTVLPEPSPSQKEVVIKIVERADCLVVMTERAKKLLLEIYGAPEGKIRVICHGIHPLAYNDGSDLKKELRLSKRKIISTFGMLNKGKGIEYAIEAMTEVVKRFPDVLYLVIGATHPVVLKQEGETYRNQLIEKVYSLGLQNNIRFYNKYLTTEDLLKFLQATDIYLSLSQDPNQAVSGTLSYALGAGRPVISTPFPQAEEIITPDVGSLIKFGTSEGIADQIISILGDPAKMASLGKTAYFKTRKMTWKNVALYYMREFIELLPELGKREKNLPAIKMRHLAKLTDKFGIFQFAILDEPDSEWGYTLDDNARALVVTSWYYDLTKNATAKKLAEVYLNFIKKAVDPKGGFKNYFKTKHLNQTEINNEQGLEDSAARAIWALAVAASGSLPVGLKKTAKQILESNLNFKKISSPRAMAFMIKGLSKYYRLVEKNKEEKEKIEGLLTEYADKLLELFNHHSDENWLWFENYLTYSNAVLPEAMLWAYRVTGNYHYFKAGKQSLDFLSENYFQGDVCVPVGQAGWYKRGEKKNLYDQQPEEVAALVLALRAMYDLGEEEQYQAKMYKAFNWFLGNNILNRFMYSHLSGGCFDGLQEKEVNLNQGAESTISYLLARLALETKA
ncbi:MAG TPA: glycosyltransferase [Candidatus Paceibacterota bacterium]|jgi:glycosyltransferase involved in cell wall biosynthesis|nr:glycosyltransferase [Candidatus Paceibacterota bacterium]HOH11221.1 glycosyltransferase [Candidatus Paceibacterota bacterium]HOY11250.1 glycosyltransferase [Candidatus Paceibacterota bacterium]HPI24377.1 glycosyltransferase [Candidatus Paceibacterota bacterium]HPV33346.1 glycosyltransferase [Candidatus Paceibacterota bacterium]